MKYLQLGKIVKRPADGRRCLVAGWGQTENNETSDVLKGGHVAVISRQKCNSCDYYNHNPSITRDMICAGTFGKRNDSSCYVSMTDACSFYFLFIYLIIYLILLQGDSGGPLLCYGMLVGVTSFGSHGCMTKPAVYSFLSKKQLKWIKKTMKSSETKNQWNRAVPAKGDGHIWCFLNLSALSLLTTYLNIIHFISFFLFFMIF